MATVATKPVTAEEFFELPALEDGTRLELVKGEIVALPGPGVEHGRVQTSTAALLWHFLRGKRIGTVVTESNFVTERDDDSVRGPDVSYYSKERMPLDVRV